MRKVISILSVLALSLSLTSCMPSGNIVGKATFTTLESSFATPGDLVNINVNGGMVITPKGLRIRLTKATFQGPYFNFAASKSSELIASDNPELGGISFSKENLLFSRLKGKNACGYLYGQTSGNFNGQSFEPSPFVMALFNPGSTLDAFLSQINLSIPTGYQLLLIQGEGFGWAGFAPANSIKIGGRNLCNGFGVGG